MKKLKNSKMIKAFVMALGILVAVPTMASAHCDTMDGPTVADGKKAIAENNVNYVMKWVTPENEKEITQIFELSMKVRKLSPDAQVLADKYFFENLVRIHRAGEGAPYTGLKPSGTPIDEKVLAADKSIELGNLSPLEGMVPEDKMPELKERFEKVMSLKDFDVNNVEAGREYIEAYVSFFHFAEGEEEAAHTDAHATEDAHAVADSHEKADDQASEDAHGEESHKSAETLPIIPWSLAGLFFVTTLIFSIAYSKKSAK